jgi:transcription elongation factor Elf1
MEEKKRENDEVRVVYWYPLTCPKCESRNVYCYSSPRGEYGMRYHKCRSCGQKFKSFEKSLPTSQDPDPA